MIDISDNTLDNVWHPLYSRENHDYQSLYFSESSVSEEYENITFSEENIIFLSGNNGSFMGLPSLLQCDNGVAPKDEKRLLQLLKDNFQNRKVQIDSWGKDGEQLLIKAAIVLKQDLFVKTRTTVDLTNDVTVLFRNIRKSYKSLINKQQRERKSVVLYGEKAPKQFWEDFRNLHFTDAKRITRSINTWNQQYEDIKNERAFCVLQYNENKLVCGGYFLLSGTHVYYGVSASQSDVEGAKPGVQSMIFEAILFAKKTGFKVFILGFSEINTTCPKDTQLLNFKMGFSNSTDHLLCIR